MGCLLKPGGGLYPRLRVGAVLLAAGEGVRMGGVAKALIRLQGVPLIRRHLVALSGAGVDEVVVVTGHAHEAVQAQIQGFPLTLAHNPDYALGQQTSVRVGLAALSGPFDLVLICLVDQPLIGAEDLTELIGAFKKRAGGNILQPMVDGQPGNPVLIDDKARALVLASEDKLGCRHLMDRQPELVSTYNTANQRFVIDLDTEQDLHAMARSHGWQLELPEAAAA